MDHRDEKRFVGKHHGRIYGIPRIFDHLSLHPLAYGMTGRLHLPYLGGNAENLNFGNRRNLLLLKRVARRELPDIAAHETSRTAVLHRKGGRIEIPVKIGETAFLKRCQNLYLGGGEHIEAHENVAGERQLWSVGLSDALHGIAVEHARRGQALLSEAIAIGMIERLKHVPQFDKAWVTVCLILLLEMIPETLGFFRAAFLAPVTADHLALLVGEIIARDLTQTLDVDKQRIGIDKIAVDIVEIRNEHIAPEHKLVEVGIGIGHLAVFIEKREQLIVAVGLRQIGERSYKVGDIGHLGQDTTVSGELFFEKMREECSTSLVGEHKAKVGQTVSFPDGIGPSHLLQKWSHCFLGKRSIMIFIVTSRLTILPLALPAMSVRARSNTRMIRSTLSTVINRAKRTENCSSVDVI